MIEEVYDYLRAFGFSKEKLNEFEDRNDGMFFTNLDEVQKNINFLIIKGLSKEEIIDTINTNPFMLTVKDNRLEALDKVYINSLGLSNSEIKDLIILNPYMYSESPVQLQNIIDYLSENNYDIKSIKNMFVSNPKYLDLYFEEFKKIINK